MLVKLYSDGSSRGNPGRGGYGTILKYIDSNGKEHIREYSKGFLLTTNNRMELLACIIGLEALVRPCDVEIYSDSKYLVDAFNLKWIDSWVKNDFRRGKKNEVKNIDLWKRLLKAKSIHNTKFIWIKGHSGYIENERCDFLATSAADSDNLFDDDIVYP